MQTQSLIAGTPEWHAHRAAHFNASDSPAMTGCSPHKTRTQLLHELKTGLAPEVDAATQHRFDDGHRFEALARSIGEEIIGDDLAPVVGTLGELSASFDGLTLMSDTNWEHKTLNDGIRASLPHAGRDSHKRNDGAMLGKLYRVQMEQQLMVSGAERTLFSATRWNGDTLEEERHCWYYPDLALRAEIVAGWKQFAIDLAAYVPAPVTVEAVGRAPETLPALHIEVTGMVTASNLDAFKANALAVFGGINRTLSTDAEFADAEKTVKWCGDVEDRLAAAKQHALSQTESIDALFRTIDDISAEARKVRLELEKLVKARKEELRGEIVHRAYFDFSEHVESLNKRLGRPYMPDVSVDFVGAVKGKRSPDSMRDAVDTEMARGKIAANAIADKIQINLATLRELAKDHAFLFADVAQIVLKAPDDLTMLVKSRIAEHKTAEAAKEEAQRYRIRAEEQAKAEKAAHEQVEREQREAAAQLAAAAKQVQATVESSPALQPVASPQGGQDEFDNWRQGGTSSPVANVVPMRQVQPATPPSMTLGAIGVRLGFNLTADFLKNLGFDATKVKASCLYHAEDFPLICAKLVAHIQGVQAKQAA